MRLSPFILATVKCVTFQGLATKGVSGKGDMCRLDFPFSKNWNGLFEP